jgi:hypothetical protein
MLAIVKVPNFPFKNNRCKKFLISEKLKQVCEFTENQPWDLPLSEAHPNQLSLCIFLFIALWASCGKRQSGIEERGRGGERKEESLYSQIAQSLSVNSGSPQVDRKEIYAEAPAEEAR